MRQLDREQMAYDRLMESGRQLRRKAGPEADREGGVGHTMKQLQDQWEATRRKAEDRKVSVVGLYFWKKNPIYMKCQTWYITNHNSYYAMFFLTLFF